MQDVKNQGNWGEGYTENVGPLYFLLNFSVNLKLLLKSILIKQRHTKGFFIEEPQYSSA